MPAVSPRHTTRTIRWSAAAALAAALAACTNVPAAFGPTPAAARANATTLFGALQGRFTNVYRAPRYERARERIGRYALTPSGIFNDTSVWTSMHPDGTRVLFGDAAVANGRYVFTNAPSATPLDAPGDGRHQMRLRRTGDDAYEWVTGVDFAIGPVTANDVRNVISRWLASAEGRSGATLRADYRAAFPRTTTAIGRLLSLDTLVSVRDAAGGNTVYLGMRVTSDGIRKTYPNYAKFIDKYVTRAKIRFSLTDRQGAHWVDGASRDGYVTFRVRSRGGHFAPLDGTLRPIPDTLVVRVDASAKIGLFTVGVNKLVGEWVNVGDEHECGWAMRFTREPGWDLPPLAGTLLRTPLRWPFLGAGTQFRITVRDVPGRQTLLGRRASTAVKESAVLRFLNKLSGAAMGDFVATAEEEENRFNATVFAALRTDVEAVLR